MKKALTILLVLLLTACSSPKAAVTEYEIEKINDGSKQEGFSFATALELIYEDDENCYYLPGIYSSQIIVVYKNGTEENIKEALKSGHISISDLDENNIKYYTEPKEK